MTDRPLQLALRELRATFARPVTLPAIVGVAALLTIAGPFGTDALMRLVPRFAYWLFLASSTYALGVLISALVHPLVPRGRRWLRLGVVTLSIGAAVTVLVLAANLLIFGYWPSGRALLISIGNIFATAVVITYLLSLADAAPAPQAAGAPTQPAILDRLPFDKRGPLLSLSVEDHYVRVRTTKGEDMILMRLSDAIRETAPTPGAQVHRSHWAAWDQVRAARREGDRAILTLSDSSEVPVSRANLPKLRAAGLLPQ